MEVLKKYIEENKKEAVVVLLISLFALVLRCIALFSAGDLWLDEIYSFYFSSKDSVFEVVKSLYVEDLHTPLYFILLHFWIKIFGQNDTMMRLLGFIPSFLAVPFSFYIGKKLFNKKCGYFASIMLAISPFAIYYSTELRFYGILFFLALLSSFFFVEFINKEDKTNKTALIITNLLLLYTFNIGFIFIFFQFLCGIIFSKDRIKVLKTYLLTGIFYIPGFIMAAHGIFAYRNTICSFVEDIFIYKLDFISIFLQSYFTGNFYYALNNAYEYNDEIISAIFEPKQIFLILFPVIFCLTGFFRAIYEAIIQNFLKFKDEKLKLCNIENKNLALFLFPSLIFLLFEFTMAHFGKMSLIARYTLIVYPVILIVCAYGFSLLRFKKILYVCFAIFLASILFFIFSKDHNVIKKFNLFGSPVQNMFDNFQVRQDDYILAPMMGKLYKRYLPKNATYIDLEVTDMLLNDARKHFPFVFDEETIAILNRKNAREVLKDFVINDSINKNIEQNLKTKYFDKMKKGQAFIVVVYDIDTVKGLGQLYAIPYKDRSELYNKGSLYYMLSSKITLDILRSSNKYLKPLKQFVINDKKTSQNNTGVFIYMKE